MIIISDVQITWWQVRQMLTSSQANHNCFVLLQHTVTFLGKRTPNYGVRYCIGWIEYPILHLQSNAKAEIRIESFRTYIVWDHLHAVFLNLLLHSLPCPLLTVEFLFWLLLCMFILYFLNSFYLIYHAVLDIAFDSGLVIWKVAQNEVNKKRLIKQKIFDI